MPTEPIHRMNLKGPWIYEWLDGPHGSTGSVETSAAAGDSPLLADSRVRMPCSWQSAFGGMSGRIRFSRRFQRPTNLDDNERVHIAFDGVGGEAQITVNGQKIGRLLDNTETVSFDMTAVLGASNELSVELSFSPDDNALPGGLHKPVAIEIHLADA